MGTGPGIRDGDFRNALNRRRRVDRPVLIEEAAMTVRCVFTQANICRDI